LPKIFKNRFNFKLRKNQGNTGIVTRSTTRRPIFFKNRFNFKLKNKDSAKTDEQKSTLSISTTHPKVTFDTHRFNFNTMNKKSTKAKPLPVSEKRKTLVFSLQRPRVQNPCSAATKCVRKSFCNLSGQISEKKLNVPDSMRRFLGVPLVVCYNFKKNEEMVCCRN